MSAAGRGDGPRRGFWLRPCVSYRCGRRGLYAGRWRRREYEKCSSTYDGESICAKDRRFHGKAKARLFTGRLSGSQTDHCAPQGHSVPVVPCAGLVSILRRDLTGLTSYAEATRLSGTIRCTTSARISMGMRSAGDMCWTTSELVGEMTHSPRRKSLCEKGKDMCLVLLCQDAYRYLRYLLHRRI